jgi:hypothetical protein
MPAAVNGMKECSKCGETKDVSEYYRNTREKDGLQYRCKSCHKQSINREERSVLNKQRYQNDEAYRNLKRQYCKDYHNDNRERLNKRSSERYHANREYINEKKRQRYQNDEDYRNNRKESSKLWRSVKENKDRSVKSSRNWRKVQPAAVYEIKNKITGKLYIGQSKSYPLRWVRHKNHLSRGVHRNLSLQSAYNKYGLDAFEFNIISEYPSHTTSKILLEAEAIEILKRVRAKQELYNNAIPQDDGRYFDDVYWTEEEWNWVIDNSIERDMSTTEFLCMVVMEWGASNLTPQNNSETDKV